MKEGEKEGRKEGDKDGRREEEREEKRKMPPSQRRIKRQRQTTKQADTRDLRKSHNKRTDRITTAQYLPRSQNVAVQR